MMEQKRMGIRTLRRNWDLCNTVESHRIMNSFTFPSIYVFSIRSQLSLSFSRFPPWESTKWNPIAHSFVRNHLSNRRLIRALSMKILSKLVSSATRRTEVGRVAGTQRNKAPEEWPQSEGGNPTASTIAMETSAIARPFVWSHCKSLRRREEKTARQRTGAIKIEGDAWTTKKQLCTKRTAQGTCQHDMAHEGRSPRTRARKRCAS